MASIVKSGGVSFAISQVIIVNLFTFDACTLLLLFEFNELFICYLYLSFWFLTSIPLLLLESFCVNFMYVFVIYEVLELLDCLNVSNSFVWNLLMFLNIFINCEIPKLSTLLFEKFQLLCNKWFDYWPF
jgi:hypothetical protein